MPGRIMLAAYVTRGATRALIRRSTVTTVAVANAIPVNERGTRDTGNLFSFLYPFAADQK